MRGVVGESGRNNVRWRNTGSKDMARSNRADHYRQKGGYQCREIIPRSLDRWRKRGGGVWGEGDGVFKGGLERKVKLIRCNTASLERKGDI